MITSERVLRTKYFRPYENDFESHIINIITFDNKEEAEIAVDLAPTLFDNFIRATIRDMSHTNREGKEVETFTIWVTRKDDELV